MTASIIEGPRRTVLVADDDDDLRCALLEVLRNEGYHALGAADGAETVAQARVYRPDVILLDYRLPDGLGTGVLRRLEDLGIAAATILMTGADNIGELALAFGLAHRNVLAKPFDLHLLVSLVETEARASAL